MMHIRISGSYGVYDVIGVSQRIKDGQFREAVGVFGSIVRTGVSMVFMSLSGHPIEVFRNWTEVISFFVTEYKVSPDIEGLTIRGDLLNETPL